MALGGGGLGEHGAGLGAATGGEIDQDGFLDLSELVEKVADGEMQPGVVGATAHEVRDLQGQNQYRAVKHSGVTLWLWRVQGG